MCSLETCDVSFNFICKTYIYRTDHCVIAAIFSHTKIIVWFFKDWVIVISIDNLHGDVACTQERIILYVDGLHL